MKGKPRIQRVGSKQLRGELEVGGTAKEWRRIVVPEDLAAVAVQQGLPLSDQEADIILGYLEGHDYSLMADADGATVRHDEQYGTIHRGDEPYTVREAVEFCQEMNEDLIRDSAQIGLDEDYFVKLQRDAEVLSALMARPVVPSPEGILKQYCVYVTELHYGSVHVEASSEDEAIRKATELYEQGRTHWHDGELSDVSPEEKAT